MMAGDRAANGADAIDMAMGEVLANAGPGGPTGPWKHAILVGNRVVAVRHEDVGSRGAKGTEAQALETSMAFAVLETDGKAASKDNLRNSALPTAVPRLPESVHDLLPQDPRSDMHGGTPRNFSFGAPFAQGNRLPITGLSHLWCIGDPNVPNNGTVRPKQ